MHFKSYMSIVVPIGSQSSCGFQTYEELSVYSMTIFKSNILSLETFGEFILLREGAREIPQAIYFKYSFRVFVHIQSLSL